VIEEHVRANDSAPLIITGPTGICCAISIQKPTTHDNSADRAFCVVGSGKSSLIASWVAQRKGMSLGEQEVVVPHFIELSDNSVHRILGRILGTQH
jgi:hypothetical protein